MEPAMPEAAFTRDRSSSVPFGSDPLQLGSHELCWVHTVCIPPWNDIVLNWTTFTHELTW